MIVRILGVMLLVILPFGQSTPKTVLDRTTLFKSLTTIPAINKAWVINLQGRVERMEFMDKQLSALKIPYERFEAMDFGNGSDSKVTETMKRFHKDTKIDLNVVRQELSVPKDGQSWGSVGCWQSHMQIYFDIIDGSTKDYPGPFFVLEDDVRVTSAIIKYLSYEYLYKTLPKNWEMIYLDHIGLVCHNETTSPNPVSHPEYCKINFTYATGGYVIRNKEVAQKLIAAGNTPQLQVADKFTNPLFSSEAIHAYAILEKTVFQLPKAFGSDIRSPDALQKTIAKFYAPKETTSAAQQPPTGTTPAATSSPSGGETAHQRHRRGGGAQHSTNLRH